MAFQKLVDGITSNSVDKVEYVPPAFTMYAKQFWAVTGARSIVTLQVPRLSPDWARHWQAVHGPHAHQQSD